MEVLRMFIAIFSPQVRVLGSQIKPLGAGGDTRKCGES